MTDPEPMPEDTPEAAPAPAPAPMPEPKPEDTPKPMAGWSGAWDAGEMVYTGKYIFPDGTMFVGDAHFVDHQVIVHTNADGFTKQVEMPVEPHFEFTGTWEKDGKAGSPMMPPDPERK